jgi:ribose transport system ATP-binding protein
VRDLSVEQNLLLTDAPLNRFGSIDWRKVCLAAREILQRQGLDIAPDAGVGELPLGQQQMLEIVRAVQHRPRVLLLDEATSALGAPEVDWLHKLVGKLAAQGTIVLFISHRWDEVVRFCNRVAVLRNGTLMTIDDTGNISETEAVRLMTGRETVSEAFPKKQVGSGAPALTVSGLRSKVLNGVSFTLGEGEILGIGGLVGQGQAPLLEALFGAHTLTEGGITIAGQPLERPTPRRAMGLGMAYVPQERKTEGLLLSKGVGPNLTLAILPALAAQLGIVLPRYEGALIGAAIKRAQIRTRGPGEAVCDLSGGNQQKVLLEKWLMTGPKILLLSDVTRGVDVGTKHHIYEVVAEIAKRGVGILWYSTDARELVGAAHRVLVMLHGRIGSELTGADVTVERIVRAAVIGGTVGALS